MITGTKGELIVVPILGTHTPLNLLQLFLETIRCIAKALHDTTNRRDVVVVFLHTLLISLGRLAFFLLRIGGNEQLVGIGCECEAVVVVDGNHQRSTQTQVGRNELGVVVAAEGNLRTDVRHVHTQAHLALAVAQVQVVLIVEGHIGSKGRAGRGVVGVVVGEVAIDETQSGCPRELLGEHHRISHVDRHLIRIDGHRVIGGRDVARHKHFTQ